jgi:hypothetical protein
MSRSRRKNWNTVNAPSLARWIVVTAFLALTGLSYVYLTLQLYHLGERSALQRRLKEGYLKMVPISEDNIVRLTMPVRPADADAIQPVANQPAAR